jgi:hypothetical protein
VELSTFGRRVQRLVSATGSFTSTRWDEERQVKEGFDWPAGV